MLRILIVLIVLVVFIMLIVLIILVVLIGSIVLIVLVVLTVMVVLRERPRVWSDSGDRGEIVRIGGGRICYRAFTTLFFIKLHHNIVLSRGAALKNCAY